MQIFVIHMKGYVVVTYSSIICSSRKKHVSDTCSSGEMILIRTEQIRSKLIFIYFPSVFLYYYWVLFHLNNPSNHYVNPPSKDLCGKQFISTDSFNKF